MHDQPRHTSSAAMQEADEDRAILGLLLQDGGTKLVSEHELRRQVGDRLAVTDALARLHGAGLVHRLGEFAFTTVAARRMEDIAQ